MRALRSTGSAAVSIAVCAVAIVALTGPGSASGAGTAHAASTSAALIAGLDTLDRKLGFLNPLEPGSGTHGRVALSDAIGKLAAEKRELISTSYAGESLFCVPAATVMLGFDEIDAELALAQSDAARGHTTFPILALESAERATQSLEHAFDAACAAPSGLTSGLEALDRELSELIDKAKHDKLTAAEISKAILKIELQKRELIGASFDRESLFGLPASVAILDFDEIDVELALAQSAAIAGDGDGAGGAVGSARKAIRRLERALRLGSEAFECVGASKTLFDNWNTGPVTNSGKPPSFSTGGRPYCVESISTYHWNDGRGEAPGTIELVPQDGVLLEDGEFGPWKATGVTGSPSPTFPGGVPNSNWVVNTGSPSQPVIVDGTYACDDSSPGTWSQNAASGGHGFCDILVQSAQPTG